MLVLYTLIWLLNFLFFFFFKQKTAYEMRISDWSSDVCSSDLIADLNGDGDVVAGIVIARFGENALAVIGGVKDKIAELARGLPEGVSVQAVYDRSDLIVRAIKTLRTTLFEESLIVALVCLLFLFHARSALVAIVMLPVGVLIAVIAMRALGMNSNLISLGGLAISYGLMVDATSVKIGRATCRGSVGQYV